MWMYANYFALNLIIFLNAFSSHIFDYFFFSLALYKINSRREIILLKKGENSNNNNIINY